MNIPSAKYLKVKAKNRLETGKDPKKVALCYAGIIAAASFIVYAVEYMVDGQISQTGGLQNIGTRSMLSTLNSILPLAQMILTVCIGLGYTAAMLRISRRQYASEKTLKAGFERFWVLFRMRILQALILFGVAFILIQLSTTVFMMTPWSKKVTALLLPLTMNLNFTPESVFSSDALMSSLMGALMPLMIIYLLMLIPALLFFHYRYRLADFILIDQPQIGAIGALRMSRIHVRGNMIKLFKIDLSFWWFYLLEALASIIIYLDVILELLNVGVTISANVMFFGIVFLYLAAEFAITYFFRNRLEVTFALAYDALIPKEKPEQEGVILGNIFDT